VSHRPPSPLHDLAVELARLLARDVARAEAKKSDEALSRQDKPLNKQARRGAQARSVSRMP
jgi:hypothetical protein